MTTTVSPLQNIVSTNHKVLTFLLIVDSHGEIQIDFVSFMITISDKRLKVRSWFLPEVVSSIKEGSEVVLMILNVQIHQYYRFKGRCVEMKSIAFLDGIAPIEAKQHFPQVEWELTIEVNTVKNLKRI